MNREVKTMTTGRRTVDGAGVSLVRVLNNTTTDIYDPILMLDSFDSYDPEDYVAGFPMHPHRGIETISYLYKGNMQHRDSIGFKDTLVDGEVQWMNSGSGILHEEVLPPSERMLGVQLWLNLPASEKFSSPSYHRIKRDEIEEIKYDGGMIRLLAGEYKDHVGFKGDHLPLDYYDIHIEPNKSITLDVKKDDSIMIFTLIGDVYVEGTHIKEKTAAKLTEGDKLEIKNGDNYAQVLFISSKKLDEPVAWAGPIVMNTQDELNQAFMDLRTDNFIREKINYEE